MYKYVVYKYAHIFDYIHLSNQLQSKKELKPKSARVKFQATMKQNEIISNCRRRLEANTKHTWGSVING